ncbi:MAG: hypothetical protein ABIN01_12840 [Ferruginibacter sp.]
MKLTSTIFCDFINDFALETTEVGVCFDAIVNFNLPMQNFNLQSEVSIESLLSDSFDTMYLLNPVVEMYKMPTLFNDVNHQFVYAKHRGLLIVGTMALFGAYTISIIPKNDLCDPKTLNELRAKKLN